MQRGDEHTARQALFQKREISKALEELKPQYDELTALIEKLAPSIAILEDKNSFTTLNMYSRNSAADNVMTAFERMEEKVRQMEARSRAVDEKLW